MDTARNAAGCGQVHRDLWRGAQGTRSSWLADEPPCVAPDAATRLRLQFRHARYASFHPNLAGGDHRLSATPYYVADAGRTDEPRRHHAGQYCTTHSEADRSSVRHRPCVHAACRAGRRKMAADIRATVAGVAGTGLRTGVDAAISARAGCGCTTAS